MQSLSHYMYTLHKRPSLNIRPADDDFAMSASVGEDYPEPAHAPADLWASVGWYLPRSPAIPNKVYKLSISKENWHNREKSGNVNFS